MADLATRAPIQPGESAPNFTLPTVPDEGSVSLGDYRGRSPVLLVLSRSVWWPFCRRHLAQLGATYGKLKAVGVDTLVVIEDRLEPVRRYFRMRPPRVPVVVDEPRATYRAYGVPLPTYSPEYKQQRETLPINPTGELPAPMPLVEGQKLLNERDKMGETEEAQEVFKQLLPRDFTMHVGHFLLDRNGIVRWTHIETPADDLSRWGRFPTGEELVAAARESLNHSRR